MKRANLNEVNLEGTNVEKAVFGKNPGLSERAKLDLEQRGAIFDDSPGDYSSSE